jgi:hypothetical protein
MRFHSESLLLHFTADVVYHCSLRKGGLLRNLTKFLPVISSPHKLRKLAMSKVSQQKGCRHLRPAPCIDLYVTIR